MDNTMRGYKDKIDDVNDFVEEMSGLGIYEFIDDLYNNEIRDKIYTVLKSYGDMDKFYNISLLDRDRKDKIIKKLDHDHKTDRRNALKMGVNIALGWIIEDIALSELQKGGINCNLGGSDSNRTYDADSATNESDINVVDGGESYSLEIEYSRTNEIYKNNYSWLRDNKFENLFSQENPFLLGFLINHNKFYIVDIEEIMSNDELPVFSARKYDKQGKNIPIADNCFYEGFDSFADIVKDELGLKAEVVV